MRHGSITYAWFSTAGIRSVAWSCLNAWSTGGSGPGADVRIVSVVGTRPQLIKAAALSPVLRRRHDEIFIDTGQHYDESMAGIFFEELGLPKPDHSLGVGSGSHSQQTGAMLTALEPIIADRRPD